MDTEIEKILNIVGSQAALAKALGLSNNAICKWVAQGFIPPGRAIAVAELVSNKKTSDGQEVTLESILLETKIRRENPNYDTKPNKSI